MANASTPDATSKSAAATPPRPTRRTRPRIPHAVWYGLAALGFAVVIFLVQLALYSHKREPRDLRAILDRELRMNTLQEGERVVRALQVFRRTGADYYRQTRGLLVLTDKRLVYLGAPPRDVTGAADAPPTFDQRVFPIDTLVDLERSFVLLGFARALEIETPEGSLKLGVPSSQWPRAQLMRTAWDVRHEKLRGLGVWAGKVREARTQLARVLEDYRRQPVYHVVRAGDAVSSIASWYETSPEKIRELNGLDGNRIKVGQRLLIRAGSGEAAAASPTPANGKS